MSETLLDSVRSFLIAQGVGRDPRAAGSLPPIWRQPANGVPLPGQGNATEAGTDAVVGLFFAGGFPSAPLEGFLERRIVDVRIRVKKAERAEEVFLRLAVALDDRRYYMAGGLRVHESIMSRPLQLLASDDLGFEFVCTFVFTVRREEMAALLT